VQQDLQTDPFQATNNALGTISSQLVLLIRRLLPNTTDIPIIVEDNSPDDLVRRGQAVFLWYCSLHISILIAGFAVLLKTWILGYEKPDGSTQLSSYDDAMRQQRKYNNLIRWGVPVIADFLATMVIFAIVTFFIGLYVSISFSLTHS
jgi:hypothetical protein